METKLNQIFGYQILPDDNSSNAIIFGGTQPVEVLNDINGKSWKLRLFSYPHTHVAVCQKA
jgi:hypothetical protein